MYKNFQCVRNPLLNFNFLKILNYSKKNFLKYLIIMCLKTLLPLLFNKKNYLKIYLNPNQINLVIKHICMTLINYYFHDF